MANVSSVKQQRQRENNFASSKWGNETNNQPRVQNQRLNNKQKTAKKNIQNEQTGNKIY